MNAFCSAVVWAGVFHAKGQHMENTLWSAQPPQHQLFGNTDPFKNSLHNTNWLEVCTHFYCACVEEDEVFAANSQVGVKACGLSLELSGLSISMWRWSHLSSADLSERRDGSALPLKMTGPCVNGPRAAAIWSEWHPYTRPWTGAVPRVRRARKVNGREEEERGYTWMVLPLVGGEFWALFLARNLREDSLLLSTCCGYCIQVLWGKSGEKSLNGLNYPFQWKMT